MNEDLDGDELIIKWATEMLQIISLCLFFEILIIISQ